MKGRSSGRPNHSRAEIGRASCRERVKTSVVAGELKKNTLALHGHVKNIKERSRIRENVRTNCTIGPRACELQGGFFFSSRRRHTRSLCDWSSDVCSSDLPRSMVSNAPEMIAPQKASE